MMNNKLQQTDAEQLLVRQLVSVFKRCINTAATQTICASSFCFMSSLLLSALKMSSAALCFGEMELRVKYSQMVY